MCNHEFQQIGSVLMATKDHVWTATSWAASFAAFVAVSAVCWFLTGELLDWFWRTEFPEQATATIPNPQVPGLPPTTSRIDVPVPGEWTILGQYGASLIAGAIFGKIAGDRA